jgi:hypothetical protein
MEGERPLLVVIQTGDDRDVEGPQFLTQLAQGRPGLGIRRALVGLLRRRRQAASEPSGDSAPRSLACANDTALTRAWTPNTL